MYFSRCWLQGHATAVTCTWILRVFRASMVVGAGSVHQLITNISTSCQSSRVLLRSKPDPSLQIEKMQPVRSDMKLDGLTWPEMFLAFIFANDLTESSIAGQHGFMPHGFNDRDVTADRNITFGRPGSIHVAVGKCDGHTTVGLQNGLAPGVADLTSGEVHCR